MWSRSLIFDLGPHRADGDQTPQDRLAPIVLFLHRRFNGAPLMSQKEGASRSEFSQLASRCRPFPVWPRIGYFGPRGFDDFGPKGFEGFGPSGLLAAGLGPRGFEGFGPSGLLLGAVGVAIGSAI